MTFECVLDPKLFRSMTEAAATVISEGNLVATPEGIKLGAFDDGHIALVTFNIPAEACESYTCTEEVEMGIILSDINAILKRASARESLHLALDDQTASIVLEFIAPNNRVRKFSLKLVDTSGDAIPSLEIPFTVTLNIHPDLFADAIKDAKMVSEYVELIAGESLEVRAVADTKTREVSITIPGSELRNYEHDGTIRCMYPLEQLDAFVRSIKNAEDLAIGFGEDSPLRLLFKMPQGSHILFLLAPRVDADDYDDEEDY